jgi:hypothetical protein
MSVAKGEKYLRVKLLLRAPNKACDSAFFAASRAWSAATNAARNLSGLSIRDGGTTEMPFYGFERETKTFSVAQSSGAVSRGMVALECYRLRA